MIIKNEFIGEIELDERDEIYFEKNKRFFEELTDDGSKLLYVKGEGMGSCPYYDLIVYDGNAIPVPVFREATGLYKESETGMVERWEVIDWLAKNLNLDEYNIITRDGYNAMVEEKMAIRLFDNLVNDKIELTKEQKAIVKRILNPHDSYFAQKYDICISREYNENDEPYKIIGEYWDEEDEFIPYTYEISLIDKLNEIIEQEIKLKKLITKDKRLKKARNVYWKIYNMYDSYEHPLDCYTNTSFSDILNDEHNMFTIWNGEFVMRKKGYKLIPVTSLEEVMNNL